MPTTSPCVPCCSTPQSVNIPGIEGPAGVDGLPGVNAYSKTQLASATNFTNAGDTDTLTVDTSAWMVIGQVIVADGPLHFRVVSTPTATTVNVSYLKYAGDIGGVLPQFAKIAPSGSDVLIQSGRVTLTAGASGTITAPSGLTAASRFLVTRTAVSGVFGFLRVKSINVGAGTFEIHATSTSDVDVATDAGDVDWAVIG